MSVMVEPSTDLAGAKNNCGSELARDEAITFNIAVDCSAAIASKLAPTGSAFQTSIAAVRSAIRFNRWSSGWRYHPLRRC